MNSAKDSDTQQSQQQQLPEYKRRSHAFQMERRRTYAALFPGNPSLQRRIIMGKDSGLPPLPRDWIHEAFQEAIEYQLSKQKRR